MITHRNKKNETGTFINIEQNVFKFNVAINKE